MKNTIIFILIVIVISTLSWFFLRRDKINLGETLNNVLPFGSDEGVELPLANQEEDRDSQTQLTDEEGAPTSNLIQISSTPVAGAIGFTRNNRTIVRYVDRATGHIYEVLMPGASSSPLVKTKITNNTLPKIYEAYFHPDASAVLIRSLKNDSDEIENRTLTLTPPTSTSTSLYSVSLSNLRNDLDSIAVTGSSLSYSLKSSGSIISSAFNGSGSRTLFTSAFSNWRVAVAGNNVVLYTKASASAPGYAYRISGSSLIKILGPLNGLIVVPNSSLSRTFYSYLKAGETKSEVKNLQNNSTSPIFPATLAEKCAWSVRKSEMLFCGSPINGVGANEPDGWYEGKTHFSDRFWRFDTNTEIAQVLLEPQKTFGIDIDVLDPKLSQAEDYLLFTNKNDLSLWALKLESF